MSPDDLAALLSVIFAVAALAMALGTVYYARKSEMLRKETKAHAQRAEAARQRSDAARQRADAAWQRRQEP